MTCQYLKDRFQSAFDMYMGLAEYLQSQKAGTALDEFTKGVYCYFSKFEKVDVNELRDCLAIDRLATNKMGALPEFLKNPSPFLKQTLNKLEENEVTKRKKSVKRAATVLSSKSALAYVDYTERDYVTNRFLVKFTEI